MKRWLLAALICAFAPSTSLAVTFVEGTDISGTPGDNMFNLDLGLNTFQGFVNPTIGEPIDCQTSATTFCTVNFVPDVDAFQAKAGPGRVIRSVAYSLGTAVTPNASNPAPGGSSYSSTLDFIFNGPSGFVVVGCTSIPCTPPDPQPAEWNVEIRVSAVPLPAGALLLVSGLAIWGAGSRRLRSAV